MLALGYTELGLSISPYPTSSTLHNAEKLKGEDCIELSSSVMTVASWRILPAQSCFTVGLHVYMYVHPRIITKSTGSKHIHQGHSVYRHHHVLGTVCNGVSCTLLGLAG